MYIYKKGYWCSKGKKKMVTDCIYLYFKLGHFLKACCVRLVVIFNCELTYNKQCQHFFFIFRLRSNLLVPAVMSRSDQPANIIPLKAHKTYFLPPTGPFHCQIINLTVCFPELLSGQEAALSWYIQVKKKHNCTNLETSNKRWFLLFRGFSKFSWLENFPRIHQVLWVKGVFYTVHNPDGVRPYLLTQQRPLPQTHSVFSCARAGHSQGSPRGNDGTT